MNHSDFKVGCDFYTAVGRWRCTDIGARTVIAIRTDFTPTPDPSWLNGPPYAVAERVFDEHDLPACKQRACEVAAA
jgi:hypothetical protein